MIYVIVLKKAQNSQAAQDIRRCLSFNVTVTFDFTHIYLFIVAYVIEMIFIVADFVFLTSVLNVSAIKRYSNSFRHLPLLQLLQLLFLHSAFVTLELDGKFGLPLDYSIKMCKCFEA